LIITNDPNAKPGDTIKGATYVCFFEVLEGGVSLIKDKVIINGLNVEGLEVLMKFTCQII